MPEKVNPHSIISAFYRLHKNEIVKQIFDYDEKHYIIEAVPKGGGINYNGGFYSFDKVSGEIAAFTPVYDLQRFFFAMSNQNIWRSN